MSYILSANLENLTLTGIVAINGTGNAKNNVINGNSGNNFFSGLDNDDTLNGGNGNDTLDGGTGIDNLNGGDNDDLYIVDNVSDVATEVFDDALSGVDTVQSSVSYTLSANLENLTLTGIAAINGTGNAKNNVINGNNSNDFLSGLDGDDTLNGGSGTDSLTGGLGNDVFVFNSLSDSQPGFARDVITDFAGNGTFASNQFVGNSIFAGDQIDLSTIDANSTIGGNQAFTFIGSRAFSATGQIRYSGGILQGSTDGDLSAVFEIQLAGAAQLVASDIIL